MATPLLILSDSPTTQTGLGRITRELAIRIHDNLCDTFRVATAGFGGYISRNLPFQQYSISRINDCLPELPDIWRDFAGNEQGVLLTILNIDWLPWLAGLTKLPAEIQGFLSEKPFKTWAYVPIDATGPNNRLVKTEKAILEKMDRLLAYTAWGADVLNMTLNRLDTPHLPHGIDMSIFHSRDRVEARRKFVKTVTKTGDGFIPDDVLLVSVVATNSARKDWYLAFEICRELQKRRINFGLWAHTNVLLGNWDLLTLAEEFGLRKHVIFTTGNLSDDELAWGYSACDVSLGIGAGEGFGLPIAEALACGIPVVHGNYAGATDFVPKKFLVEPTVFRGDGFYCVKRPAFRAADWADKILEVRGQPCILDLKYSWDRVWPQWERWLKAGVE